MWRRLLICTVSAYQVFRPGEIEERWSRLREGLSDRHNESISRAQHDVHTLRYTAGDHAVHNVDPNTIGSSALSHSHGFVPVATINITNPKPWTVPLRKIAANVLFDDNEVLPTVVPGQGGALP